MVRSKVVSKGCLQNKRFEIT